MSLYNLSSFMTKLKEDMQISDIPLPISDERMVERFENSALKEFSQRYPLKDYFELPPSCIISKSMQGTIGAIKYRIPKSVYQNRSIIEVYSIDVHRTGGFNDFYMPTSNFLTPVFALETIADIQMAAAMGQMMGHAPTFHFQKPDILFIFNGWAAGAFTVEAGFSHDISLATIPDTAFTHLFQLAQYDMEEFLYGKLKRKNNMDGGTVTSNLNIDDWQNSGEKKKDLLKQWDDEGVNLDNDRINYW